VIGYTWHDEVPSDLVDELADLLSSSAEFDAEAGFSTAASPGEASERGETGTVRHLLVTMPPRGSRGSPHLDRLPDVLVVAYLRLRVVDSVGWVQLVVRPEFRSLGVATLLFERLGECVDGWQSVAGLSRLAGWAHGSHPAAERLSWRFDASIDGAVFKTLLPLGGSRPFASEVEVASREPAKPAPELLEEHDAGMAPDDQETRQRPTTRVEVAGASGAILVGACIDGDPTKPALLQMSRSDSEDSEDADELRLLLSAGLTEAQNAGARAAQLYVDVEDDLSLHVSREIGFFHDQSDVRYVLDLSS
jgi:mycothiol synthase